MRNLVTAAAFLLLSVTSFAHARSPQTGGRQVRVLANGWAFTSKDVPGAEAAAFDDASWQRVSVPHDWTIAGPVDKSNSTGQGGGFFPSGIAWYRKDLPLTSADEGLHVFVAFDGVMANSDVWINGHLLGHRPNGYVSFHYDVTPYLHFNGHNILAVRTDTSQQPASRWYQGNGIYRPARLILTDAVHIVPWGTVITTPAVSATSSTVHVCVTVTNDSNSPASVRLVSTVTSPSGASVATLRSAPATLAAHATANLDAEATVTTPDRWDIDHPALYKAQSAISGNDPRSQRILDSETISFGIREFHFTPATGFWLNGRNFKVKGAAIHGDGGAVGIAVPNSVYERNLLALRAVGVNAIRTAHNPPSPDFLDLCDRLGFLVMDEMFDQWTVAKNPYDYHLNFREWSLRDTADTVQRDRNHPSIILWSAGNEIHDTPKPEIAIPILKSLVATFHENDPTRPVTQALFRPNVSHDYDNGLADLLDVVGQNYREQEVLAAYKQKPTRKMIGTENAHDRNQWVAMRDYPEYSGQFIWSGIDYLGESGGWPRIVAAFGLVDRTGHPRAWGLERESWWLTTPNIHMVRRIGAAEQAAIDPGYEAMPPRFRQTAFLDWTPANTAPHNESVELYTNCEEADLLLNGVSLGRQKLHADATPITWSVPYAAGTLRAVGYNNGKPTATDELRTASAAAKLALSSSHKTLTVDANDVLTIDTSVTDAQGTLVPAAAPLLHYTVSGPGVLVATDNADFSDHESFQSPEHHAFQGRGIVLVRASGPGKIVVTVSAPGLTPAALTLNATPAAAVAVQRSF